MPSSSASVRQDLLLKLTWLTVFRTVATSLLLLAIVVRLWASAPFGELSRVDSLSFALIGGVYALTLGYGLFLRRGRASEAAAYVQVLGDVVLATVLVYLTGGADSPFTFTYSIAVVAASILLYRRGAFVAAASSSMAFVVLTALVELGALTPPFGSPIIAKSRLAFLLVSNALAQFLIAALASYLGEQLSVAGGRLRSQEANLQEISRLQNQIVASMPSGLITCEEDGRVTFVNPAAAAILGIEPGRPGLTLEALIPGALQLKPHARRAELSVETRNGRRILGLMVTPLEGKTGALLIVFQDLTDLRRIEEELKRVDHLASLGKLSAQLAHEIRNPLASMRGSAQILAQETHASENSKRLAQVLIRESDRLSNLVEDFLRFARPPPPALRSVDLLALATETVEMMKADPLAFGVSLSVGGEPVTAMIDEGQIRQVLLNLLRNALAAAGPRGQVRVSVEREANGARLSVWDSAGGIPPADLGRIFDPFYTTRPGGTGLGLSTAHSIVAAHGGKIHVTSSPAEGTLFQVALPAEPLAIERAS